MLYSGILLQRKERHTELHVSKAIISWLYFPASAVHHKLINLPKCAYLNWPSLHTKKTSLQNTSPFPFFLAQILYTLAASSSPYKTSEILACTNTPVLILPQGKLQRQPSACNSFAPPATFPSLWRAPASLHFRQRGVLAELFNSLQNSLHMTHFRYPQVLQKFKKRKREKERLFIKRKNTTNQPTNPAKTPHWLWSSHAADV